MNAYKDGVTDRPRGGGQRDHRQQHRRLGGAVPGLRLHGRREVLGGRRRRRPGQLGARQPRRRPVGGHQQQRLPRRAQPGRGQRRGGAVLRDELQRGGARQHLPWQHDRAGQGVRRPGRRLPGRHDLRLGVRRRAAGRRPRTDQIEIHDNTFEHNWSGITLWENADRFCNSPANTSTGDCTKLVADQRAVRAAGHRVGTAARATAAGRPSASTSTTTVHDRPGGPRLREGLRPHGGAVELGHLPGVVAVPGPRSCSRRSRSSRTTCGTTTPTSARGRSRRTTPSRVLDARQWQAAPYQQDDVQRVHAGADDVLTADWRYGAGSGVRDTASRSVRSRLPHARLGRGGGGHRPGRVPALGPGRPRVYRAPGRVAGEGGHEPVPDPPDLGPRHPGTLRGPVAAGAGPDQHTRPAGDRGAA